MDARERITAEHKPAMEKLVRLMQKRFER